jgi:hypothetical protein
MSNIQNKAEMFRYFRNNWNKLTPQEHNILQTLQIDLNFIDEQLKKCEGTA